MLGCAVVVGLGLGGAGALPNTGGSSPAQVPDAAAATETLTGTATDDTAKADAVPYQALGVQGDLLVHERFRSRTFGARRIFVFLPSEYELFDERRYPVLYLLDGQNYFDPTIAAGGEEWALDELLVRHPRGVPEMLVVGVQAGAQSVREFSPPGSSAEARGAEYVSFLAGELKPYIDMHYRTKLEPASTLIVGQGSSAVLALYAAWVRGDTFGGAIALEFPDVDAQTMLWSAEPPPTGRPWLWLEQTWSERARTSTTELVANLQRHSETHVVVSGPNAPRAARMFAALKAMPLR